MAKSTTTKPTRKRPVKKSAAKKSPAVKKSAPAKQPEVKLVSVKLTNADGSKRTVKRPAEPVAHGRGGTVRDPRFSAAAERASALVCTDANGAPTNRARIGTKQIGKVAEFVAATGKQPRQILANIVGENQSKSLKIATDYADDKIGRTDLPDGMADRLRAIATSEALGDPAKHKLSGKALAGAFVGLVEHPAAKS